MCVHVCSGYVQGVVGVHTNVCACVLGMCVRCSGGTYECVCMCVRDMCKV